MMLSDPTTSSRTVLALDIGTSVLKGAILNRYGSVVEAAQAPVKFLVCKTAGHHECDPAEWTQALLEVVGKIQAGLQHTAAVVVSGNGPTLVPVGSDGCPLHPAITWLDRRAQKEAQIVLQVLGYALDASFFLPKVLWLQQHKPQLYNATHYFLPCPEYMAHYLTGNAVTILPANEYKAYIWETQAALKLGLDPAKFPRFVHVGATIGTLRKSIAVKLGLTTAVPVIAGAPDFLVALLGTAVTRPGKAMDRAGTSEGVNACAKVPITDQRLLCLPHMVTGLYNIGGMISTSGKALEWLKNIVCDSETEYQNLFDMIDGVPAGARNLVFLPYLAGERSPIWDPCAKGTFLGLTLAHGRGEMLRACLESVGYAIRDVIDVMLENGCSVDELRVSGSQARSTLWNQIKADVTGREVLVPEVIHAELVGDACVGFTALGDFGDVREASENMVRIRQSFRPRREFANLYSDLFAAYRAAYRALKSVFRSLHEIAPPASGR